jgi:hypothetical protein
VRQVLSSIFWCRPLQSLLRRDESVVVTPSVRLRQEEGGHHPSRYSEGAKHALGRAAKRARFIHQRRLRTTTSAVGTTRSVIIISLVLAATCSTVPTTEPVSAWPRLVDPSGTCSIRHPSCWNVETSKEPSGDSWVHLHAPDGGAEVIVHRTSAAQARSQFAVASNESDATTEACRAGGRSTRCVNWETRTGNHTLRIFINGLSAHVFSTSSLGQWEDDAQKIIDSFTLLAARHRHSSLGQDSHRLRRGGVPAWSSLERATA